MKIIKTATKVPIIATVICAVLLQGCSSNNINTTSSNSSIETVDYGQLDVDIDQSNHSFSIKCESVNKDLCLQGKLLTFDHPKTVDVYKIIPFDEEPELFYNPIKEYKRVWFQALTILMGQAVIYSDGTVGTDRLSRDERNSVIKSMERVDSSDIKQMEIIKAALPNATFSDYALRYTYPAIKSDLYQISTFDKKLKRETLADTIKDRSFDYYVIRRSINGIVVGMPYNIDTRYVNYNKVKKEETSIYSEDWKMFYDGVNIYEVHTNDKATEKDIEIYLKDQPVLTFEQAMSKASPTITQMLTDSAKGIKDTHIYAAELVYLTVQVSDMRNVDYYNDYNRVPASYDAYLYPFWAIYILSNQTAAGEDIADHRPLLVNAVTGEVLICN